MNYEKWKKGIVVGISNQSYFVASSNEEHVLPKTSSNIHFSIGDCINFVSSEGAHSSGGNRRSIIWKFEKCAQFVEWELHKHKNGALIKSNIIDVTIENHPHTGVPSRCLRTEFLEKVYDTAVNSKTANFTDSDLKKMKAVACRIVNDRNDRWWALLGCDSRNSDYASESSNKNGRITVKGIVLVLPEKDQIGTIYFWVPGRRKHIAFPKEMRQGKPAQMLHGRWISIDLNYGFEIDNESEFHFIDDCFPTRFLSTRCEVRVPVNFDMQKCGNEIILDSKMCGSVVDTGCILKKYNIGAKFSDEAWVYHFPYDVNRDIRFVLSGKQDEWEYERRNHSQYREDRNSSGFEENRSSSNSYQDDYRRQNSHPLPKQYESDVDSFDRIQEERKNFQRNRENTFEEDLSHNKTFETSHFEKRMKEENEINEQKDRRRPERSHEIYENEGGATSSRGKEEVKNEKPQERRNRSGMPIRKYEDRKDDRLSDGEEERQTGPSRSRTIRDRSIENRQNGPSRSNRSPSSKRDDISFRSVGETSNSNLRKLKKRYEYLMANDMNIPEKLVEELKNALKEERELAKKKNVDYSDFDDSESGISGIREKRQMAKIEVNEEELKTYKQLVILFREMLSSPRVCEEMHNFDSKAMREINRLISDL